MYSRFELTVPGPGPVSRDLILTLSNLLRRLAVSERGERDDIDIGFGVTLFCAPDTLRFSSETELSAHIPPLAQIDGFHLSVMFNPWHMHEDEPSLSLHIHKPGESASFSITVEAVTQARAQELALEIADVLAQHTVQQDDKQHIGEKPEKQSKKSLVAHLESFNTVSDSASHAAKIVSILLKLIRFFSTKIFLWF